MKSIFNIKGFAVAGGMLAGVTGVLGPSGAALGDIIVASKGMLHSVDVGEGKSVGLLSMPREAMPKDVKDVDNVVIVDSTGKAKPNGGVAVIRGENLRVKVNGDKTSIDFDASQFAMRKVASGPKVSRLAIAFKEASPYGFSGVCVETGSNISDLDISNLDISNGAGGEMKHFRLSTKIHPSMAEDVPSYGCFTFSMK